MAEDRFIDYFDYAGLDPAAPRQANYDRLKRTHLELKDKHSDDAGLAKAIVSKAMAAFSTQEAYDAYRARWAQRQQGSAAPRAQQPAGPAPSAGPAPAGPAPAGPAPAGRPAKGVKAALLEIGANALRTVLENRADAAGPGAGLTGTWRDNMGATLQVRQAGANVAITVMNGFGQVVSQGRGILAGTRIDYEARDAAGQSGRGVLMVSPDGRRIEGEIAWYDGFNMPAGSGRVLLVRA